MHDVLNMACIALGGCYTRVEDYRGHVNVSAKGRPCLNWEMLHGIANEGSLELSMFHTNESWQELGNFCRCGTKWVPTVLVLNTF